MSSIILTPDQVQVLNESADAIVVLDPSGKVVGKIARSQPDPHFSDEDIAAAKAALRAPGPRHTTAEVLARLRALERS
jgi:hypothetical protein